MKKALLPLIMLVLMGAGCSASTDVSLSPPGTSPTPSATEPARTAPAPVPTSAPTPAPAAPAVRNSCANEYFPLRAGYEISYANQTPGSASQSTHTMKVTSVLGTQATVSIAFNSGIRSEQVYDCTDGNVRATGYVDLGAGMTGVRATSITRSSSGQLIPSDARVGSTWSATFDIATSIAGNPTVAARQINTTVTTQRTAEAEESVTVPAGTFQALKVRSSTTFVFDGAGMTGLPPMEPVVGYEWWVKGKGMVKTTSGVGSQAVVSEATAIVTP